MSLVFLLMSSFCSRIQFRISHCISLSRLPNLLLVMTMSQSFLGFSWPWQFWRVLVFADVYQMSLNLGWSDVFVLMNLGLQVLGKITEVKCPSHALLSGCSLWPCDVTSDVSPTLGEGGICLLSAVTAFPSYTLNSLEGPFSQGGDFKHHFLERGINAQ